MAYHRGTSIIKVREQLDESKPWELFDPKLPAPRINFVAASNNKAVTGEKKSLKLQMTNKCRLTLRQMKLQEIQEKAIP